MPRSARARLQFPSLKVESYARRKMLALINFERDEVHRFDDIILPEIF